MIFLIRLARRYKYIYFFNLTRFLFFKDWAAFTLLLSTSHTSLKDSTECVFMGFLHFCLEEGS
jgi:hypothetical protein